jgi:hypothetical protein
MTLQFPNSPTDGELYTDTASGNRWVWDNANTVWKSTSTFTQTITVSSTQPGSPVVGQLWWSQDYGRLFVYYNDGNSSQWVEANPADQTAGLVFNTANAAYGLANTALQNTSGTFAGSMYVTGTLGVGATFPEKSLEVAVANNTTNVHFGIKVSNYSFTTGTRSGIVFKNADNNGCAIWSRRTGSASGELYFGTNSGAGIDESNIVERMRIDASGRITKPYQPFARVYYRNVATYTVSSGQIIPFNTADENVGNCFNTSTGRFTCPVAGTYLCMSAIELIVPNTDWTFNYGVAKNASFIAGVYEGTPAKSYWSGRTYAMVTCAAGDFLDFRLLTNTTVSNESLPGDARNYAMIYLLG